MRCFDDTKVFIFLLMTCLIPNTFGEKNCPKGWAQHSNSCYMVITTPRVSWSDARVLCRQAGGELALPVTEQETKFLWSMFRAQNLTKDEYSLNGGLWMGCRRAGAVWECTQTPTLQFVRWWQDGQPDGSDDCLVMWRRAVKWADVSCDKQRFTACQLLPGKCARRQRCLLAHSGLQRLGCLMNHVLKEVTVVNPLQCCTACYNNPRCHSFNLQGSTCQLNIAQRSNPIRKEDNFMVTNDSCAYYEIEKD